MEQTCETCQQTDDHPKVTVIRPSYSGPVGSVHHHDCIADQFPSIAAIVEAAGGAQGHELQALLDDPTQRLHSDVQAINDAHYDDEHTKNIEAWAAFENATPVYEPGFEIHGSFEVTQ